MKLYVKWANGKEDSSDEIVTDTKPPHVDSAGYKRAHWSYRFDGYLHYFGLVRATRYQWLEQQSDGTTNYHTREEFSGTLRNFVPLADVQNGFERQTKALKACAERK
ncbi:unnamed protein product [Didymodactylos carnosus]|uniref:Uncharacterized protein n=1 Tax=Didymodactylos carnosus TaxID=1234261 RepID=A0A813ZRH3_9BILA|nr:unnamed protein product [Didymodactylos carnosus]CAF3684580.1 unnamed protein product [Didymodactylos carnosus]